MSGKQTKYSYDIIIAGAGAAGLSLLYRILQSPTLSGHKVLVIDKDQKQTNDRTWCFWEHTPDLFEPIIFKSWPYANFHTPGFNATLDLSPYTYKMIRGIDFYEYVFQYAREFPNVTIINDEIQDIFEDADWAYVKIDNQAIKAKWIFSSLPPAPPVHLPQGKYYLLQHFKGYMVRTETASFNPDQIIFMDFRVDQHEEVRFGYVLPFSETNALIEYTVFSKSLLQEEAYDRSLKKYIDEQLKIRDYKIEGEEFGVIPMTNLNLHHQNHNRIINIGTAGGYTKASTGYTFKRIQEITSALVNNFEKSGIPKTPREHFKSRFMYYDAVLLGVMAENLCSSRAIFGRLFSKNKSTQVLKFLEEKTTPLEELKIISTLPVLPFFKSAVRQLFSWL